MRPHDVIVTKSPRSIVKEALGCIVHFAGMPGDFPQALTHARTRARLLALLRGKVPVCGYALNLLKLQRRDLRLDRNSSADGNRPGEEIDRVCHSTKPQ
jgi:hypothetical protein